MIVNIKSKRHTSSRVPGRADSRDSLLAKLFLSTLYLSASTPGGGHVIVTLIKKKFVDEYHWTNEREMLNLVAIAQSSPGAIAVNGAIVVNYKLADIAGILAAVVATILPPFTTLTLISFCHVAFYSNLFVGWILNGMRAGMGVVIAQVVWEMGSDIVKDRRWISVLIIAVAFIANYVYDIDVVLIVLLYATIDVVRILSSEHNKRGTEGGAL